MLLALLLVARAAAEWVEISQQHYRKPVRFTTLDGAQNPTRHTYHNQDVPPQSPTKNTYFNPDVKPVRINPFLQENEPEITPSRNTYIYPDSPHTPIRNINFVNFEQNVLQKPMIDDPFKQDVPLQNATKETHLNHSITEHNWNLNVQRHNKGNTRVTTKQTTFNERNGNKHQPNNERNKPGDRRKYEEKDSFPDTTRINEETVSGKIERVPNIGSIKRVQLENTPVKSPALNNKVPDRNPNRRSDVQATPNYDNFNDESEMEEDIFKDSHVKKKPSNSFKHVFSSTEDVEQEETLISQVDHRVITKVPNENSNSPTAIFHRHSFTPKQDLYTDKVTHSKGKNSKSKQNSFPEVVETPVGNKIIATDNRPAKPQEQITVKEDLPDFVSTNEKFIENAKEEVKTNVESDKNKNKHIGPMKIEKKQEENKPSTEKSEIKVNTMENILKFMKVVADTISKNTRRGANGKITYLNELKHTLLANIKERIDATWPDDGTRARARRSASGSARGHVEFPSSESALMTISFLTFAVFLIKLVLQVIQTYKHKSMVMAPLMVATAGRVVAEQLRATTTLH